MQPQNILDIIAAEETEDVPCNHNHNDLLLVAAKRDKPKFRKYRVVFSVPLKENGQPDWDAPNGELKQWTQDDIAAHRAKTIQTYLPLLLKERKGRHLLRKHVNTEQWAEYQAHGYFHVVKNGTRYRLQGYYGIRQFDAQGREVVGYCLHAKKTTLPQSDVLIMQKLMLEAEFEEFTRAANATPILQREHVIDLIDPKIFAVLESVKENEDDEQVFDDDEIKYHEAYNLIQKMQAENFTQAEILTIFEVAVQKHRDDDRRWAEWEEAFEREGITEEYQKNDIYYTLARGLFCTFRRKPKRRHCEPVITGEQVQSEGVSEEELRTVLQELFTDEEIDAAFATPA